MWLPCNRVNCLLFISLSACHPVLVREHHGPNRSVSNLGRYSRRFLITIISMIFKYDISCSVEYSTRILSTILSYLLSGYDPARCIRVGSMYTYCVELSDGFSFRIIKQRQNIYYRVNKIKFRKNVDNFPR